MPTPERSPMAEPPPDTGRKPGAVDIPPELREEYDRLSRELAPLRAKHEAWKKDPTQPKPTIEEYQRISALARSLLDIQKGRAPLETERPSSELLDLTRTLAHDLETALTNRFREFGKTETISINPPELPEGLTRAHLEAIKEALGAGSWP